MAFEKYWEEKKAFDSAQASVKVEAANPSNAPIFNHAILFKTIDDRNSMSDAELRQFIHNNFYVIMNNVFSQPVSAKYLVAFQEARFLDAFIDVAINLRYIEPEAMVRINLIIYDYITYPDNKPEILDRMKKLAGIVNYAKSILLKKYNLPGNLDIYLLIARYSDFDLRVCIRRVNLMLIRNQKLVNKLNIDPSTEASSETIDYLAKLIYDLFDQTVWIFALPFFMLDVIPQADDNNPNVQWVTPYVESMYSAISLALLQILDTMIPDSGTLKEILKAYSDSYRIMTYRAPTRFSFQCISEEYPRLKSVITYLAEEEKVYVP